MGDTLAQDLYAAYRANVDPEQPSWGNLSSLDREAWEVVATKARNVMLDREAWEVVATKARNVMLDRVFGSLSSLEREHNWTSAELVVASVLRARFNR